MGAVGGDFSLAVAWVGCERHDGAAASQQFHVVFGFGLFFDLIKQRFEWKREYFGGKQGAKCQGDEGGNLNE